MKKNASYAGIDIFRFISALLIIAIHTSPLLSYSETGDFIFTRIISRVAVPFFFMTSGFFLISRYSRDAEKLRSFVKKTSIIYIASILIYIPINIYNDYFSMDNLLPNIIKDIVFDGTLYHLWYLPASILGAAIAWWLVKRFSYKKAFIITSLLYVIGMFGDSYYGIASKLSCAGGLYDALFQVSEYTRNGLFFAPIFFVVGGYVADKNEKLSLKAAVAGFAIFFSCMLAEGLTLHHFDLQRHDSMYLFLVPCIYCLFGILIHFRGKRRAQLRNVSLLMYVMHPFVIVVIRLFAKIVHLESLLIENSLVHFIAVSVSTIVFSFVVNMIWEKIKPKKSKSNVGHDRSYLEINLNNLGHNVKVIKDSLPEGCEIMAVMKAEAYGHGAYETSVYLSKSGINAFAVATIEEGISLRKYGVTGEILILGYTDPARAKELRKYKLIQTLIDYKYALLLSSQGYDIQAHIKIDTGMHRLGFDVNDTTSIINAFSLKHIKIVGIFTHLCVADSFKEDDVTFTQSQTDSFYKLLDLLKSNNIHLPKVHIQSSYGLLNYPDIKCDYVRMGVALYGVLSSPNDRTNISLDLKPVMSLKSKIIMLREIKKGDSVGYGRTFVADRDSLIAMLPIGYADGLPRSLSCGGNYVLINGKRAPFAGRICMDQLAVDVTDIKGVAIGDVATIIGRDGDEEITTPEVADNSGSISNELLSRMGGRLGIVYIK